LRHTERELVGRGDVNQPRIAGNPLGHDAFRIHRHQREARAVACEELARGRVARVFHGHAGAGFKQHAGQQVQRLLCAVGDHDMRRIRGHAARIGGVVGDGLAQFGDACGIAVACAVAAFRAQRSVHGAPPFILREVRGGGAAADEVILRAAFLDEFAQRIVELFPARERGCRCQLRPARRSGPG